MEFDLKQLSDEDVCQLHAALLDEIDRRFRLATTRHEEDRFALKLGTALGERSARRAV